MGSTNTHDIFSKTMTLKELIESGEYTIDAHYTPKDKWIVRIWKIFEDVKYADASVKTPGRGETMRDAMNNALKNFNTYKEYWKSTTTQRRIR